MPSSTSYLRDYHDVSALKYFSALCVTIVATLEDVASYFVSDRCDDGIELATIIGENNRTLLLYTLVSIG